MTLNSTWSEKSGGKRNNQVWIVLKYITATATTILKMTPMLKNMQCESQDEKNQMQCTRVSVFPLWLPLNDACEKIHFML